MNNLVSSYEHFTEGTCNTVDQVKESTKSQGGQLLNFAEAARVSVGQAMDLGSGIP